jgi:hypothetical protein
VEHKTWWKAGKPTHATFSRAKCPASPDWEDPIYSSISIIAFVEGAKSRTCDVSGKILTVYKTALEFAAGARLVEAVMALGRIDI